MLHLLVTDIEGSTRRWERDPDAMAVALREHDALLRQAVSRWGGRVVKSVGDGLWAVFEDAAAAVCAAVDIQRDVQTARWDGIDPIRVRVALHSAAQAEIEERDGDLFGAALNRCARLVDVAHPGQILLSAATADAARQGHPEGPVGFRDLGTHRLRDLLGPEHVHQVLHDDLPSEFPPLRSLDAFPNNLPVQRTTFVGREVELGELRRLVGQSRLVTLTGAGGAGKTRLAVAVAGELVSEFGDGVWLIDLAPLRDAELLAGLIAATLGVREQPRRTITEVLTDHLRGRRLLLVVDNCEHLVDDVSMLVDHLLAACPDLHLLVTSRERLDIPGEVVWPVAPLPVAEPDEPTTQPSDAVRLFLDRCLPLRPGYRPTAQDLRDIATICRRVDGIPLAIELAAARTTVLSPAEVVSRLDDRFLLLTGGGRGALPHHQTLRATLDWSHDLLDEPERILFRRLGVFTGPVPLSVIERVITDRHLHGASVLDLIAALVSKSLVVTDHRDGRTRYDMLDTVRAYATERLLAAEEAPALRDAHADWLLDLAETLRHNQTSSSFDVLPDASDADLRAGLDWLLATRPLAAVDLAAALANVLWVQGRFDEARRHLERAMETAGDDLDQGRKARARSGLAVIAVSQGDLDTAQRHAEPVAAGGRYRTTVVCLWVLATVAWVRGMFQEAQANHERGIAISRDLGHERGESLHLAGYARVLRTTGDHHQAETVYQQLLDAAGNDEERSWALDGMARVAYLNRQPDRARQLASEALQLYERFGYAEGIASAQNILGLIAITEGDLQQADTHLIRGLELGRTMGHRGVLIATLEAYAALASARTDHDRTARLLGYVDALRAADEISGRDSLVNTDLRDATAAELGDRFAALHEEGAELELDQAMELARHARAADPMTWPSEPVDRRVEAVIHHQFHQ